MINLNKLKPVQGAVNFLSEVYEIFICKECSKRLPAAKYPDEGILPLHEEFQTELSKKCGYLELYKNICYEKEHPVNFNFFCHF